MTASDGSKNRKDPWMGVNKQRTYAGFTAEELFEKVIKFERGDDPIPFFVGPITGVFEEGDHAKFTAEGAAVFLLDRPLPFALPLNERISNEDAATFWWKQLDYVFGPPDPRSFPPLNHRLPQIDREAVERFIETAGDLAESGMLNSLDRGFSARKDDETGEEIVQRAFGPKDLEVGMSALLRHCDSRAEKDGARFEHVHQLLLAPAAESSNEQVRAEQLRQLELWRAVIEALHARSLDQCVRDRLVAERGWKVFDYREHYRPDYLIRVYDYGDTLHWPKKTPELAALETDEFLAAANRHSFFEAMAGLAHLYVGFGEVARTALGEAARPALL
jgi:hypothetical protein